MTIDSLNAITSQIIKAAIEVHKALGPGLLESVYERCMLIELRSSGLHVQSQVPVKVAYKGQDVADDALRLDLLVENQVVVELKSVKDTTELHKKQLLSYLRLAKKPLGLLINFNTVLLKDGVTRITDMPIDRSLTGFSDSENPGV